MFITKRNGSKVPFDENKIVDAVIKAYIATSSTYKYEDLKKLIHSWVGKCTLDNVEDIQDYIEYKLLNYDYTVGKAYMLYRAKRAELRSDINYMIGYQDATVNAATASNSDPNANVHMKNAANLEAEVPKMRNRKLQREMMRSELKKQYGSELANQYIDDLVHHTIYVHDETCLVLKNYCEAVSLYPLLQYGTAPLDGTDTKAPKHLQAFIGQLYNATFLLSSQCKGAVAFGELFNAFVYYLVKDFGVNWRDKIDCVITSDLIPNKITLGKYIDDMFQAFVYNINQPAGNRAYQSPFTNISYYDKGYWHALFNDFYFPDGTKPVWEDVSFIQKRFMKWFNKERTKALFAFPVETMALLCKDGKPIDTEYEDFVAEMYAEGHSFFTYMSDNADSLSSCCRLKNKINDNTFSFTNGLTGVQTGSCNVITLNLNRIVQDFVNKGKSIHSEEFKIYFSDIVRRVQKYHIAFKNMLYKWESNGMFTASKAGYIHMNQLYSTIGLNGINEAAEFLGIKISYNKDYKEFCNLITGTISKLNAKYSTKEFRFNTEFVPAESLGSKNYKWDKADGYKVPLDRNLYNSYFYLASDPHISVLDKLRLHGKEFTESLDGGVGCHINLDDHLTKEQYLKVIRFAGKVGCSYFTFNIPNCKCDKCGYIKKHHFNVCPNCGSTEVSDYSRVIGYLIPIKNFDINRQIEAKTRVYTNPKNVI